MFHQYGHRDADQRRESSHASRPSLFDRHTEVAPHERAVRRGEQTLVLDTTWSY
jgi:hypothetical protein